MFAETPELTPLENVIVPWTIFATAPDQLISVNVSTSANRTRESEGTLDRAAIGTASGIVQYMLTERRIDVPRHLQVEQNKIGVDRHLRRRATDAVDGADTAFEKRDAPDRVRSVIGRPGIEKRAVAMDLRTHRKHHFEALAGMGAANSIGQARCDRDLLLIDLEAGRAFEPQPVDQDGIREVDIAVERDRHIGVRIGHDQAGAQREGVAVRNDRLRVGIATKRVEIGDQCGRCGSQE